MNEHEIKQLIAETAAKTATATVLKLQAAGILQNKQKSAYDKTEALLHQYTDLCKVEQPYAEKVVAEIDSCMADISNEPYAAVIRLYYFEKRTNAACALELRCDERTCRRQRKALVEKMAARLASEEFIRELLL